MDELDGAWANLDLALAAGVRVRAVHAGGVAAWSLGVITHEALEQGTVSRARLGAQLGEPRRAGALNRCLLVARGGQESVGVARRFAGELEAVPAQDLPSPRVHGEDHEGLVGAQLSVAEPVFNGRAVRRVRQVTDEQAAAAPAWGGPDRGLGCSR